jgi:hypothetical protein
MKDYLNKITKQAFAIPDKDEMEVAMILVDNGAQSVLFLAPNLTPNTNTPDIFADQLYWEIKTPYKSSENTLKHSLKAALRQSENVIFYIKKLKIPEQNTLRTLKRLFISSKSAKRLKVITKNHKIIDFIK